MNTTKSIVLAATTALALTGFNPNTSGADSNGRGFLAFEGGVALTQGTTFHGLDGDTKVSFDRGLRFDVRGGVNFNTGLSFDLDLGVIYSPLKENPLLIEGGSLDLYEIPIMLDFTYTFPRFGPFRAYLGAGLGGVYGIWTGNGTSFLDFTTDITFGYQGTAGIKYEINDRWDIGVAYKFLGTTEHDLDSGRSMDGTLTHSLMAVVNLKF